MALTPADELIFRAVLRDEMSAPLKGLAAQLNGLSKAHGTSATAARRNVNALTATGRAAGSTSAAIGKLRVGMGDVNKFFNNMAKGALHFVSGVGDFFLKWLKRAALGLVGLVAAGAKWGFSLAIQLEQAQVGFTKLFHSSSKATEFLSQLKIWSTGTPFRLTDLIGYAQQLGSLGNSGKQTMSILQGLGDAVSASGRVDSLSDVIRAYGRISATARLTSRDLQVFATGGIGLRGILKTNLGISDAELSKKFASRGGTSQLYAQAGGSEGIIRMIEARYKGGLAAQAKTLKGLFTTVKDVAQLGLAQAEQPFVAMTGRFIQKHIPAMMRAMDRFGRYFARAIPKLFGGNLHAGSSLLANALGMGSNAAGVIENVLRSFRDVARIVGDVLAGIGAGFASLGTGASKAGGPTKSIADILDGWAGNGENIKKWVKDLVKDIAGVLDKAASVCKKLAPHLGGILRLFIGFFIITKITAVVEFFIGVLGIVTAATDLWTAAFVALDAAMDANPVGVIILIVAGLALAVYAVVRNMKTLVGLVEALVKGLSKIKWPEAPPWFGDILKVLKVPFEIGSTIPRVGIAAGRALNNGKGVGGALKAGGKALIKPVTRDLVDLTKDSRYHKVSIFGTNQSTEAFAPGSLSEKIRTNVQGSYARIGDTIINVYGGSADPKVVASYVAKSLAAQKAKDKQDARER